MKKAMKLPIHDTEAQIAAAAAAVTAFLPRSPSEA